jgi:hypothetical protein
MWERRNFIVNYVMTDRMEKIGIAEEIDLDSQGKDFE